MLFFGVTLAKLNCMKRSSKSSTKAEKKIVVPTLFLRDQMLVPKSTATMFVGREKSVAAVNAALHEQNLLFLPLQKKASSADPLPKEVYDFGALAYVQKAETLPDGTLKVLVEIRSMARRLSCVLNEGSW